MKKNIAVVWGGYSSEKEVSERSAKSIYSFIDKEKYNVYKVKIDKSGWEAEYKGKMYPIDKNNFGFSTGETFIRFHFAYITIHGTPGEDGVLQGYFDLLGIPYSNCGVLASSLTFSKFTCNHFLKSFGFNVADSVLIRRGDVYDAETLIRKLGLPVFVKPNVGGSSFATTKVKDPSQLSRAIDEAFDEAPEVLVERFIPGREITCGCYQSGKGFRRLPLTEVVTKNEFFDYNAKYKGEVEEITPARLSDRMTEFIQSQTEKMYALIGAKGIIRADYIISGDTLVFLEVNTTPGMTETSFIPQQVKAAGIDITELMTEIIEFEYNKAKE